MPHLPIAYRTSDTTRGSLPINKPWACAWPILAVLANAFASNSLHRNQDLKEVFGAKEQEWLVSAVLLLGQHLVPFMLISSLVISSQIKDKFKNNLFLNVFLIYLCLSVAALFSHVLQYEGFHIEVEDIEQHNSRSKDKLFTACLYAIVSLCSSKTVGLPFEVGFFSACLGYAMQVSLSILDKNGYSQPVYVSCTFFFCFIFIMFRKYLEKDEGVDRTRQRDNQSPVVTDTTGQSPDSASNTIDLQANPTRIIDSASNTIDLQANPTRIIEPVGRSALNVYTNSKPSEPTLRIRDWTSEASMGEYGSDEREVRQESWDDDEHHWEIDPSRLSMDTSSNSGDTANKEEDVPSVSKCVLKEGKDIIMTHLEVSKPSDEGTSASDDNIDKIEESEIPGQEIGHEEQDMGSSTSSGHMEIAGSSGFGGYEKDDVPLLLPKSDNIINGEAQIVSIGLGQMERSVDQSQESGSQGHEKDDNPPLLPKSSLKVDKDSTHLGTNKPSDDDDDSDHESSDDEGSDDDGFHGGTGCNLGVGRKSKDLAQESDCQELGNMRPLSADISEIASGSNLSKNIEAIKTRMRRWHMVNEVKRVALHSVLTIRRGRIIKTSKYLKSKYPLPLVADPQSSIPWLAVMAKGRTRWSRAILMNWRKLKFRKHKRQRVTEVSGTGGTRSKKPRVSDYRLKGKSLPAVQRKERFLDRLLPGVILEEAVDVDYKSALQMRVRALKALADAISAPPPS